MVAWTSRRTAGVQFNLISNLSTYSVQFASMKLTQHRYFSEGREGCPEQKGAGIGGNFQMRHYRLYHHRFPARFGQAVQPKKKGGHRSLEKAAKLGARSKMLADLTWTQKWVHTNQIHFVQVRPSYIDGGQHVRGHKYTRRVPLHHMSDQTSAHVWAACVTHHVSTFTIFCPQCSRTFAEHLTP